MLRTRIGPGFLAQNNLGRVKKRVIGKKLHCKCFEPPASVMGNKTKMQEEEKEEEEEEEEEV